MSEHMRNLPTESVQSDFLVLHLENSDQYYKIPTRVAKRYQIDLQETPDTKTYGIDEVFSELEAESSRAGVLLKGLRLREGLTQKDMADKLGVQQSNLSKMESGKRSIGKALAKRIANAFNVNFRYFLD